MMPVAADQITPYVSRCAVCYAYSTPVAVHSQSRIAPNCPEGWKELWSGYSFVMHAVGAMGGGQDLASPGSCMENFRANPYIECNSRGECHFFSDKFTYWLVNTYGQNFESATIKAGEIMNHMGRCKVCIMDLGGN
jgi:collagen type IV alpha